MNRDIKGRFKSAGNVVVRTIKSIYDHIKKTIVTILVLSVLYGIYSLPTLVPKPQQYIAKAEVATSTPSILGGDFDYLYASLENLQKDNVRHRLANPKNIQACVEQIEAKVNQDINILTKTF